MAKVVSFDVFDTLLLRGQYSPTQVFMAASQGSPRRFWLQRILAERLARYRHRRQEDISLAQIYDFLGQSSDHELAVEQASVYANPEVAEIYVYARAQGKRIIAISDMYLPAAEIKELLATAGYPELTTVYVSNELGLSKARGTIYPHVCQLLGIPPSALLHIGDNIHSDYSCAIKAGCQALHIASKQHAFEATLPIHPKTFSSLRRSPHTRHHLLLGLMRDALSTPDKANDYWYSLGFSVAGPVLNAYANWIRERCRTEGYDHVYFLARDGYLLHKIFALRFPEISASYTFASRRLFLLPAMHKLEPELLDGLCAGLPGTTAQEYWRRLGIANPDVERLLVSRFGEHGEIWSLADRQRLRDFFRDAHTLLEEHIAAERKVLTEYLNHIGLLGGPHKPLLVDVGWRASSQRYLETAYTDLTGCAGAYFGLDAAAYRNGNMRGYFFDAGAPAHARKLALHCVEIIELMFSAPHPSIRGLQGNTDTGYSPVYEKHSHDETLRAEIIERMDAGVLDFSRRLLTLESRGTPLDLSIDDLALLLEPVLFKPSPRDLQHLGRLPHALGLGDSRYETLLPATPPGNPLHLLSSLIRKPRQHLYWPRGMTHAVSHAHGCLAGFGARISVTAYLVLLSVRNLAYRLLGK